MDDGFGGTMKARVYEATEPLSQPGARKDDARGQITLQAYFTPDLPSSVVIDPDRADAAGLPAYLESSNPRNISLYERHGFEIMGRIQVGDGPLVTPMLRPPR